MKPNKQRYIYIYTFLINLNCPARNLMVGANIST